MGEKWTYTASELHRWLNAQPDFYNRLSRDQEAEIDQIIWWAEKIQEIYANIDEFRARLAQKRLVIEATKARIREIVKRQRAEVEMELEEQRIVAWNKKIHWLKNQIDQVVDKISYEMRERHREAQTAIAAEHAKKAAEDLKTWEMFKRLMQTSPANVKEITMDDLEQQKQAQIEAERLKREFVTFQSREGVSDEENNAVWEAFKRRMDAPSPETVEQQAAVVVDQQQQQQVQAENERLKREIDLLKARETPTEEENLAAWEAFKRESAPKKRKK